MEDRWERVRQIVREECERIEQRILASLEVNAKTARTGSVKFELGKWVGITPAHLAAWQEAYPAVDAQAELKLMAAHLISNPSKSPRSDFGRFINTWLRSNQNRSAIRSIPTRNEQKRICAWCGNPSSGRTNGNEHCSIHANKALYEDPPAKLHEGNTREGLYLELVAPN